MEHKQIEAVFFASRGENIGEKKVDWLQIGGDSKAGRRHKVGKLGSARGAGSKQVGNKLAVLYRTIKKTHCYRKAVYWLVMHGK